MSIWRELLSCQVDHASIHQHMCQPIDPTTHRLLDPSIDLFSYLLIILLALLSVL